MRVNVVGAFFVPLYSITNETTMNTATGQSTNDPLGYQRFALTESAYDLITSLTGVYARLRFKERQKESPDLAQIDVWQERIAELQKMYREGDWSDLPALETLIGRLVAEYKQHTLEETILTPNAADSRPKAILTH